MKKLFFSALGFMLGFGWGWFWEARTKKIYHLAHVKGYHFHHSLYGIVSILLIPVIWHRNWLNKRSKLISVSIGFSLGVITQHSRSDGFVSITKD